MIDLSKFVDKKVRVTFRNGCICEGKVLLNTTKSQITNPYYFKNTQYECGYTRDGFELDCTEPTAGDITHIEEIKSMIDLSKFVGKKVRVTFRNGCEREVKVCKSIWYELGNKTFSLSEKPGSPMYSSSGVYLSDAKFDADIIHIEEIKIMKYEELEKRVAEMQKEIDHLKREEKNYPKLKTVKIIRTVTYTPEEYFKYCEENGEEPSEEGYLYYYSEPEVLQDCFMFDEHYTQEIKEVEN